MPPCTLGFRPHTRQRTTFWDRDAQTFPRPTTWDTAVQATRKLHTLIINSQTVLLETSHPGVVLPKWRCDTLDIDGPNTSCSEHRSLNDSETLDTDPPPPQIAQGHPGKESTKYPRDLYLEQSTTNNSEAQALDTDPKEHRGLTAQK